MKNRRLFTSTGFTLIELLIVVAIIAILAAIAVPNFLEAQVRSKVSRARADLRSLATAVEAYAVDNNKYPADYVMPTLAIPADPRVSADSYFPPVLSTPVAYITSAQIPDAFVSKSLLQISSPNPIYYTYFYQCVRTSTAASVGQIVPEYQAQVPPMGAAAIGIKQNYGWGTTPAAAGFWLTLYGGWKMGSLGPDREYSGASVGAYDATNGTVSTGDIWRTQVNPEGQYRP